MIRQMIVCAALVGIVAAPGGISEGRMRILLAVLLPAVGLFANAAQAAERAVTIPAPAVDAASPNADRQTVVLAGGCFWGVQAVFQHTKGVTSAVSGYAGGEKST